MRPQSIPFCGAPSGRLLSRLLTTLSLLLVFFALPQVSNAQSYAAEGWSEEQVPGRKLSLVHDKGEARLEAWSTKLPDSGLVDFRETFNAKLKASGFKAVEPQQATVKGYPAVERIYTKTFAGQTYNLRILEVHVRGQLWHFSVQYKESEDMSGKTALEQLHAMAAAMLG